MKYLLFALTYFLIIAKSNGQVVSNSYGKISVIVIKDKKAKKISSQVEKTSIFPRKDSSWIKNLENILNKSIPYRKVKSRKKYVASVRFIVTKNGNIADVICERDPGVGICEELVRYVKKSSLWLPSSGYNVREIN
jgi:hypothetical protein